MLHAIMLETFYKIVSIISMHIFLFMFDELFTEM